jgi:hypothetical protein
MLILQSVDIPECPVTDKFIRAQIYKVQLIKQSEESPNDLDIVDMSSFNLMGSIPPYLMNMAMSAAMPKGI